MLIMSLVEWRSTQVFLAMIKYIEDLMNVEHDTAKGLVRVVLLVEDSIYFYSVFCRFCIKKSCCNPTPHF